MKRTLRHTLVPTVLALGFVLAACSSDGGTLQPPVSDISGTWDVTDNIVVTSGQAVCGTGETDTYQLQATQDVNTITVVSDGNTFAGTLSGSALTWSGSFPEDGGTTTTTINATVSGTTITGTSNWSWSDGAESCGGSSSFTAKKR